MNNLRSLAPFIGSVAQKPHTYPWWQPMDACGVRSDPRSPGDDAPRASALHGRVEAV
ncbi:hypothetical protein [Streptomyces triticiradicis]|uniref:hypothetical protein n=1 Tax=Streptomyces triticiradicis TaxID=2651189 RepID=UPI001788A3C7|nr:hypothetical protein [Streptomyces triticiradicis]